jgi:hypothetical protein
VRPTARRGLKESTDAWGLHLLEDQLRAPRSRAEEADRLDLAIAETVQALNACTHSPGRGANA